MLRVLKSESLPIRTSEDVVIVRRAVRTQAVSLGFNLVDQTKLVTASSELARNTLDYGGGGAAQLEVIQNEQRAGLRVVFNDQGPGIPADEQNHLFEKFNRLPNIRGRRIGTGLGKTFGMVVADAAPDTVAPVGSVTLPEMAAATCARAAGAHSRTNARQPTERASRYLGIA